MTPQEINLAWARRAVADRKWLLHPGANIVGQAVEFFDGAEKVYVSDLNGEPVPAPVVKLSTGDALLAEPNRFVVLEEAEVGFHALAVQKLAGFVQAAAENARASGVRPDVALATLAAVLAAQLGALRRGR